MPGEPTPTPASVSRPPTAAAAASRTAAAIASTIACGPHDRGRVPGLRDRPVAVVEDQRLDLGAPEIDTSAGP
jgi:hypothetical protein